MATYAVKVRISYEGFLVVEAANPLAAQSNAKAIIDAATTFDAAQVPVNTKLCEASEASEIDTDVFSLP